MTATQMLMRAPGSVRKLLPLAVTVLVLVVGFSYVKPRLAAAFQATNDLATLEQRAASLRGAVASGAVTPVDTRRGVAAFEKLVAKDDRVPDLMEILARLAIEPANANQARGLLLDTGQTPRTEGTATPGARPSAASERQALDPRWALFPGSVEYTPITVTYETTFDRVGSLLWGLRDLPTAVEVRSLDIARGLPLLKVKLTVFVLRRSDRAPAASPAPGAAPAVQPIPRVAANFGSEGARVLPWR